MHAPDAGLDIRDFDQLLLDSALGDGPQPLGERLGQVLNAGGKRIRPVLVFRFGSLCGSPPGALTDLALAVEMLHTATLVHDDLIDQAETRRGQPTVQHRHGPETAVLVGDLYVARCGVHLARLGVPRAAAEVWAALDRMVRSEISQRDHRFDLRQTADDYMLTIQSKTASLLEAACAGAVLASGGGETLVAAARNYAVNLGLAFQVVDDVLDYTGAPDELGKPAGNDIRQGTVTLPLILARELSTAPIAAILDSARERDDYSAMVQAVRRSGAVERCLALAERHSQLAVAALEAFPATADRDALAELARGLPARRG